jgi:hypothetical protein
MAPSRSLRHPEDAEDGGNRDSDPTRVATDFFAALALQDWEDAIRYVEPRSLVEFRESQLGLFGAWASQRDELRHARTDPNRKTYVSVWDSAFHPEVLERHGDVRLHAFGDAPTLRELARLPAAMFAERYLAAGRGGPSAYRVFGHVLEGEDVAHVVYRPIDAATGADSLDVAVLHARRHDGRWYVLLSREIVDEVFILFHLDEPDDLDEGISAG